MTSTPGSPGGIADLRPIARRREQRAWYFYDWANSAYVTTVTTVLFAPYLIAIAREAAVDNRIDVLGLSVAPGALPSYIITFSTLLSALILPPLGAMADRTARKKELLAGFAWVGAGFASLLFFVTGENWQLGALAVIVANLCLGASVVVNDSILCLIAEEDERDRVSSRGWAFGYLGGGILLALNLALVTLHDTFGVSEGMAVRISMLSAAVWWAGFTIIPFRRLRNHAPTHVVPEQGNIVRQSFGQLAQTLRDIRKYPVTLTFLLAYLFFNDGIQTVIASSSTYGAEELGHGQSVLIATILLVQFVGVVGALVFGKAAERYGARPVILVGLAIWMVIVTSAYFLPEEQVAPFLLLAVGIGIVLGGTQALARSYFSLLIPKGSEAEYFSFYHAMERGTSWFGTLVFVFVVVGGALLLKVDTVRGIRDAGNEVPSVV
jgi:UMF1 family MFS transporter